MLNRFGFHCNQTGLLPFDNNCKRCLKTSLLQGQDPFQSKVKAIPRTRNLRGHSRGQRLNHCLPQTTLTLHIFIK